MKIDSQRNGDNLTLRLQGRLETSTAPQLEEAVDRELEGTMNLQIDMGELEYMSSAGLRVLLAASKKMKAKQGSMVVCNAGEDIMEVFEITGFKYILNIQ